MTAHLPEIREAEAPPDIARIYADIKGATGLPQVNLIFRHLATHPSMLDWVWQTLRPLYLSQELADAAAGLSRSVPPTDTSPLPDHLAPADRDACRGVLAVYNSGNAQNLIGLTAFVHVLDGVAAGTGHPLTARRIAPCEPGTAAGFPPIPRRQDLPVEITTLLARLGGRHRAVSGVIPSLYVHLSLWPELLPVVDEFLAPRLSQPAWPTQVQAIIDRASMTARDLAASLAPAPPPRIAGEPRGEMADTIRTFVNATIPEMVVVGRWLAWT